MTKKTFSYAKYHRWIVDHNEEEFPEAWELDGAPVDASHHIGDSPYFSCREWEVRLYPVFSFERYCEWAKVRNTEKEYRELISEAGWAKGCAGVRVLITSDGDRFVYNRDDNCYYKSDEEWEDEGI